VAEEEPEEEEKVVLPMTSFHLEQVGVLLVLGAACAVIAMTISKASIFEQARVWLDQESNWLGDLVACPYCTSHWVALAAIVAFQPRPVETPWYVIDMIVAMFALTFVSSIGCGAISRAFEDDE
jgi:uncharacterized Zn-finger protein